MKTVSSSAIALGLVMFTGAAHAQATQPQAPTFPSSAVPPAPAKIEANTMHSVQFEASASTGNTLQVFGPGSQAMRQMRERLKDPQQRAALRTEWRGQIAASHPDIGPALDIDAATEEKLIELLTDDQMDRLDEFHLRSEDDGTPAQTQSEETQIRALADRETRRVEALRELLGQERLERYQTFQTTSRERTQVAMLDARLGPAHKLRADQKERLIAVYQEHNIRELDQHRLTTFSRSPFGTAFRQLPSAEELQRISQLQTIAGNEEIWRRMPQSDRLLRQRAAEFLTQPQLTTLAQMNAADANSLQRWIKKARAQAGLSPNIPERSEAPPEGLQPPRTPLAEEVKLSIKLAVNGSEPAVFTHVGRNGEPATFAIADGLFVEARPTAYDDEMFDLQMTYYEEGSTGKRVIGRMGQMGPIARAPVDSSSLDRRRNGSTVVTGSKGYAVEVSVQVEPM